MRNKTEEPHTRKKGAARQQVFISSLLSLPFTSRLIHIWVSRGPPPSPFKFPLPTSGHQCGRVQWAVPRDPKDGSSIEDVKVRCRRVEFLV